MGKSISKFVYIVLLIGIASLSQAQDVGFDLDSKFSKQSKSSRNGSGSRYNALKGGFQFAKVTFSYERAIIPKVSIGVSADGHFARFKGYTANLYARFYTRQFGTNGFFFEGKGTYGAYNPVCYESEDSYGLHGEHKGDISGVSFTGSVGYRWVFESGFLIETGFGFRGAKGTFGVNDKYFETAPVLGGSTFVKSIFYSIGPGGPVEVMFNMGYCF